MYIYIYIVDLHARARRSSSGMCAQFRIFSVRMFSDREIVASSSLRVLYQRR